ncbi:MAG: hypothetical protein HYU27_03005 [Acidobacteria bacterium]|nr:hypothetical protein [Acidobacteriota bacterium]
MKTFILFLTLALATLALAQGGAAAKWTITEGISTPESAYVDTASGFLFISQVVGQPNEKDGKASVFADGPDLEWPNGLLVDGGRLIVAAWGKPEADFSTKAPGRVFALDLKTQRKTLITPKPAGNFDGIESDGKGGFLATDYLAGKLLRIMPNGDVRLVRQFMQGAADLAFVPKSNLAIVPHMNENRIAAWDISDALR